MELLSYLRRALNHDEFQIAGAHRRFVKPKLRSAGCWRGSRRESVVAQLFSLATFPMRAFRLLFIGAFLWFELMCVTTHNPYPHGEIVDVRYRGKERITAYMDYRLHPSPETEAKFHEELRLMHKHEDWKGYAALGVLVALNIGGIYLLMKYDKKHAAA